MRKQLLLLIAMLSLVYAVQSQTITDTASLRAYINANIVPNASGSITAAKMNNVLNGIATLMKNYAVDSAWWLAPDTLVLGRRGGYAAYKVRIAISPAGAETDPTVSSAAKSISSGDVSNWNSKQAALSGSSTVSIIANVVSAANTTALWNANQLQGRSVSSTAPTTSQVLSWDGAAWSPATVTGAADGNNYTTGNTFNTATGILTQTRSGLSSLTVDLDGRYFDNITRVDSITRYYKDGVIIFADTLFTTNLARPLYAIDQYTIGVKNDSAAWNAKQLQGRAIASTAPTDGQAIVWDSAGSTWKPGTVSGGGGTTDLDTSRNSTEVTVLSSTGNDAIIKGADAAKAGALSAYDWGTMADYYNIQKAGADSTGATDVSAYIIAGLATGRPVYIPKGTYLVSSAIIVPDNALIFGDGNRSIIKTTADITVFSAGDYVTFQNIKIIGDDGTSSQIGINIDGVGGVRLNSVWMVDLGVGVKIQNTNSFYGTGGLLASDIVIESGGYGIWALNQGEYMNVTAFHIKSCTYGVYNAAGNNNFSSGNITDCTYGFYVSSGTNNGHATMSTVKVNHCTNTFYATGVSNGYKVIGCMFYYGKFSVLSSSNVQFSECDINVNGDTVIVQSSSGTYFANCNFYGTTNWNVTGTKPLIASMNSNLASFRMDLAGENKPADYSTSNGFAKFGGSTIQRFLFEKPIFGANAPATYTHDMNTGSFNMDYAASQGLSDPFRVYNPSTTSGTVAAFMANNLASKGYYALRIMNSGRLAIHQNDATASVHIGAGIAAQYGAPLKLTSGVNLTTPENGAFEYDGSHLYFTPSGATRKKFPLMPNSTASNGSLLYGNGTDFSLLAAGTNGHVLTLSGGVPSWVAPTTGLPSQTGNTDKFLKTDGTNASWAHPIFPWDYAIRDSASTSNAVATTAHSVTVDANSRGIIEVRVEAVSSDGSKGLTGIKRVRYKKIAGTLTLGTVETEMAIEYDGGLSTANFTITTSSNNPIIQVTGEAAQDLNWKVTVLITNKSVFP